VRSLRFLLLSAVLFAACASRGTPVTPAPLSPAGQTALAGAILGTWRATHTREGTADKKEVSATIHCTFNLDGSYVLKVSGNSDKTYKYRLDGKNMITDSPEGTYRVDEVTAQTMQLFHYGTSTVWYLERA
jgi:hypothetical protein